MKKLGIDKDIESLTKEEKDLYNRRKLTLKEIEDIKRISEAGYRMPQKSTYFYPKLITGLVMNKFADRN